MPIPFLTGKFRIIVKTVSANATPWKAFTDHLLCVCDYAKFLRVLPYFVLINQLYQVGIFLPTLDTETA